MSAIFKYTGKNVVLICNKCKEVIKYKQHFTNNENDAYMYNLDYPNQYCDKCKNDEHTED